MYPYGNWYVVEDAEQLEEELDINAYSWDIDNPPKSLKRDSSRYVSVEDRPERFDMLHSILRKIDDDFVETVVEDGIIYIGFMYGNGKEGSTCFNNYEEAMLFLELVVIPTAREQYSASATIGKALAGAI